MVSGSTWIRTASILRAERIRCSSPSALRQGRPVGARDPDHQPALAVVEVDRAEHLGAGRCREQGERVVDRAGLAGDGGQPGRRRQVRLLPLDRLPLGEPGRVPPDQRLESGVARVADREHPPAGTDQRGGVQPAAYGLLAGAQVDPGQGQPGVEQDDGGVPALGDRLGAGGGHDDVGPVGDGGADPVAAGGADGGRGEGPAELLGGAGVAEHRGAQAAVAALGAGPVVVDGARTSGTRGGVAGPVSASGPVHTRQRAGVRQRSQARLVT